MPRNEITLIFQYRYCNFQYYLDKPVRQSYVRPANPVALPAA